MDLNGVTKTDFFQMFLFNTFTFFLFIQWVILVCKYRNKNKSLLLLTFTVIVSLTFLSAVSPKDELFSNL